MQGMRYLDLRGSGDIDVAKISKQLRALAQTDPDEGVPTDTYEESVLRRLWHRVGLATKCHDVPIEYFWGHTPGLQILPDPVGDQALQVFAKIVCVCGATFLGSGLSLLEALEDAWRFVA